MVAAALTIFNGCEKEGPAHLNPDEKQQLKAAANPVFAGLNEIAFSVENNRLIFESVGDAIYKRKGHTMFREPISQFFYPHMSDFETSWRPFYGTRRVECYNITMDFKFNIYNGAVSPHTNGYTKTERLSIYCNQSQCM